MSNNISAGQENHQQFQQTAPPINLHRGGPISGIGENFGASPIVGTGLTTLPFSPTLSAWALIRSFRSLMIPALVTDFLVLGGITHVLLLQV
jgi:hypothetical protein